MRFAAWHCFGSGSGLLQGAWPHASSFDLTQKKQSIKAAHQHTKGPGILWKKPADTFTHYSNTDVMCDSDEL